MVRQKQSYPSDDHTGGGVVQGSILSVSSPTLSTPEDRTLSTTLTTSPYFVRASLLMKTDLSSLPEIRSRTCDVISSTAILVLPRKTLPSLEMATMTASSLSALGMSIGLVTLAKSTGMPGCNMGVTTMKMMSSTSMMSAMGMIFGDAITEPDCTLK